MESIARTATIHTSIVLTATSRRALDRVRVSLHRPRQPEPVSSCDSTQFVKASIPLMTVSKRMEWNRSKVCCPPGSTAKTTGFDEVLRSFSTKLERLPAVSSCRDHRAPQRMAAHRI